MMIQTFADVAALQQRVVDDFCDLVSQVLATQDRFTVSLSGGSTPKRIYEMLSERALPWTRIHFFWGDERNVPHDHDDSNAWSDWFDVAGLPHQTRRDTLIVPDPNVRVQAVIDGQGIALNDALVAREVEDGLLVRLSTAELSSYGYFLVRPHKAPMKASADAFVDWLQQQ